MRLRRPFLSESSLRFIAAARLFDNFFSAFSCSICWRSTESAVDELAVGLPSSEDKTLSIRSSSSADLFPAERADAWSLRRLNSSLRRIIDSSACLLSSSACFLSASPLSSASFSCLSLTSFAIAASSIAAFSCLRVSRLSKASNDWICFCRSFFCASERFFAFNAWSFTIFSSAVNSIDSVEVVTSLPLEFFTLSNSSSAMCF
mmetsp:Transcript_5243/g.15168  ORF Transcript_5243/g.15168 Transcript_5243/m.15168 type:complete len:204 (+) Transcript_5243:1752-2363(+)